MRAVERREEPNRGFCEGELVERLSRAVSADGAREVFPGFSISRWSTPTESARGVYEPAFCFVAQGAKEAQLGDEIFRFDPEHYMIYTVDLPLIFRIAEASAARPYLGFSLTLDPSSVASVIMESGIKLRKNSDSAKAMDVNPVSGVLLDAIIRLVRLIDDPAGRKVLAPLIKREIIYRLLEGGQGPRLAHLLSFGDTERISKAVAHLRQHFDEPVRIEDVAQELGMSVSRFHHHFKSVTAMTPLQYQKQIRLQEARRLMLSEDLDAASAGFRVGYEDPAYFSRDYKKQFGAPPQRDISALRGRLEV
ncbi:MAG: AraC family transcriptional regulator CmrA [Acidobacteria bacterium]|nr:MAG: AraC family transcriptional regulator CmrA [Acidobacteriota bacterium]